MKLQSAGNTDKIIRTLMQKNKKRGGKARVVENQVLPSGLAITASGFSRANWKLRQRKAHPP